MNNTKTTNLNLSNNITMISPIDFISKEENEKIIERVKDGLRNLNNPNRWMSWEESDKILKEKYFANV